MTKETLTKETLMEAVRKLREHMAITQTQFAGILGRGMSTIQRWEQVVPPRGPALATLARAAEQAGRHDIASVFEKALESELGTEPRILTHVERALTSAIVDVYRVAPKRVIASVEVLVRGTKRDPILLNQLESLLVILRKDSGPVKKKIDSLIAEIATRDGVTHERATLTLMQEDEKLMVELREEERRAGRGTAAEKTMAGNWKRGRR